MEINQKILQSPNPGKKHLTLVHRRPGAGRRHHYLITERVGRPTETLNLPDEDWVQGLADIFMHGVLKRET